MGVNYNDNWYIGSDVLETPYFNEKPPYKQEIQMLKDGQYIEGWRE